MIRSPLPLSQAVLRADGTARLFLDPAKVTDDLPAWLGNQVSLEAPEALDAALAELAGQKVLVDPGQSSAWYFDTLAAAGAEVVRAMDPCTLPRACKNAVEIAGTIEAHKRDGAALTRFLHWLATEGQVNPPDEKEAVAKLEAFREATGVLKDLSFDTIGAANGHGALPHYRPTERSNERAAMGSLLLVDSGGQYLDGTTDVTRTVAIGEPTAEMVTRNTLVLKGHLAIARLRFPAGTTGSAIDAFARAALWSHGLDYDHGTGHGVGVYLGGPRRAAADQQGAQHHRPAAGHDRLQRAGLLQGRRIRHPHREPRGGDAGRGRRDRRPPHAPLPCPDPGPDRPAAGGQGPAVGRGDRPVRRVSRARVVKEIGPLVEPDVRASGWKRSRAALGVSTALPRRRDRVV